MDQLPKAAIERLIRQAGAERVSDSAAVELGNILEEVARNISSEAIVFAKHAGRKTVTADDVKLASRS